MKIFITSLLTYLSLFAGGAVFASTVPDHESLFKAIDLDGAVYKSDSPIPREGQKIGEGTHGKVTSYELSPHLCSKVVKSSSNALHEMQMHTYAQHIISSSKDPHIVVPRLIKFKEEGFEHHIIMDRISPSLPTHNRLIHLTWNYPLYWESEDSQGVYLGICKFIETFGDKIPTDLVAQKLGKFYGLLHNHGFDAFDMEFVISVSQDSQIDWEIYGYDFDKCNVIDNKVSSEEVCIERKISEEMKEQVKGRIKIFARAIAYYPAHEDLFAKFKASYMQARVGQAEEAARIMEELEKFISFEEVTTKFRAP